MKIIAALLTAAVLLAGCSGTSSEPPEAPRADASEQLDREELDKQVEAQARQREAAMKELEKSVDRKASEAKGVVRIVIDGGKVSPQGGRVKVKPGEKITLSITSDVDEELHVHSDPEHTFQVKPGKDQEFSFAIDTPGQVAVEAHHAGVTLVQLVVRP